MIPLFKVFMADDALSALHDVIFSGYIGEGRRAEEFERAFGGHVAPTQECVLTNSCTSAIELVLKHLEIGPGDEVVTTPMTCVATNAPIVHLGARPVWADVDPKTGIISHRDVIERKISSRTRAIIGVNWTGRPVPWNEMDHLGIPLIEDAAHGPFSSLDRPRAHYTCYSFGPIKHLTAGDGGAVILGEGSESSQIAKVLRLLRWYGLDRTAKEDFRCEQDIYLPGMKWHMNDVNATIGMTNLKHLDWIVRRHKQNALYLYEELQHRGGGLELPPYDPTSSYWVFPILPRAEVRDAFKDHLTSHGIQASQVHARNDKHTAYQFNSGRLPGLDEFDSRQLNIPCGWWLSQEDLDKIITEVRYF